MTTFTISISKRVFITLSALLTLLSFSSLNAQAIYSYDYGATAGGVFNTNNTSGTNGAVFSTPAAGTFFYGLSSNANASITGANPGLLRLGTLTEAQARAGNGQNEFAKFGIYAFESNNYYAAYNKFDVILAGSTGTNFSDNGVWYFFAGDGGKASSFMNVNTLAKNLLQTSSALRWTFAPNGALYFSYYSYLTASTGQWISIPGTYSQATKYTIEVISNKGSSSTSYSRFGTTYTCNSNKMDIWVNGSLVVTQGNISSISNQLVKVDSYCFYGEGSNTAYLFTDDNVYTRNINTNAAIAYYSKSSGNLNDVTSWNSNRDGTSGSTPANFTTDQCTYFVQNNVISKTLTANWTVSGTNSKVVVESGANFIIPADFTYTGVVDVSNGGTLTLKNTTPPTFGQLSANSTVDYAISGDQNIAYPDFGNMKTSGTGTKTLTTNVSAAGTITVGDGTNAGILTTTASYGLTGNVTVGIGATLQLLSNTSNITFGTIGTGSTVEYGYGSDGQTVAAGNYYNLTFSNFNKTLASSGTIGIANTFTPGSASGHTISGSTVAFNGTSAQTLKNDFSFNNLTISNPQGLVASANLNVDGILSMPVANPTLNSGVITLDTITPHRITMGANATTTGKGDVSGKVKRTTINQSTTYTFGNQFTTISLSPGTMPSYIEVTITLRDDPFRPGAIDRRYEIVIPLTTLPNPSMIAANFHYRDEELNGNDATLLTTGDYDILPDGSMRNPDEHGKSSYDILTPDSKYIGMSNVPITYFINDPATHQWRTIFSMDEYTATNYKIWAGRQSSEWANINNWLDYIGPDVNSKVIIPDASTTGFDPIYTLGTAIQSISIEKGGVLTLGDNLTVNGVPLPGAVIWYDADGGLIPNGKKVIFTGLGATFTGTTQFYDVEIGNEASLINELGSVMKISNSVIKTGTGKWYTDYADNTVEYNGDAPQTVLSPDGTSATYHNLILSGSRTKTMPGSPMTLTGYFTLSGSASADIGAYSHIIKGNFTNNSSGSFTTTGSTITLSGASPQTIGGTASTTFNNLTINNSEGVTLNNNATIGGDFTLTSGAFNVNTSTLNLNNTVTATSGSLTSSATGTVNYNQPTVGQSVLIGNYGNLGFSNVYKVLPNSGTISIAGTFSPGSAIDHTITGSTFDFNGSGAQTIPAFKYNNLNVTNSGANMTLAGSGTISIAGTFSPGSTSFGTITGSTIEYNGGSAQTQSGFTYNNLILNNSNGLSLTGDCKINGALTLTHGVLNTNENTLYFETSSSMLIPGGETYPESNGRYISGIAYMLPRPVGTGTIDFLYCNIQGSVEIGDVSIARKTGTIGVVTTGGVPSAATQWDVTTSVVMSGSRNVKYTWPSALDNLKDFTNYEAQMWYYNETSALWEAVGNASNVSALNPRYITVNQNHFSQYVVSSSDAPLPVVLSSLTSSINERNVKLNWSTSKEINNSGFDVERADAVAKNLEYVKVGFVGGAGNTNNPVDYSFTDSKLNTGNYKYRLKQIDYNGNFTYYELNGNVEIGVPGKFNLSQNYPNPFNPVTKIDFDLPLNSKVNLVIYDVSGREVKTLVNDERAPGYYTLVFNASSLSSGVYFYRIIAKSSEKDFVAFKKMVLIK